MNALIQKLILSSSEQESKGFGKAMVEFVKTKFPFDENSTFNL
jgi:hypothetical protein